MALNLTGMVDWRTFECIFQWQEDLQRRPLPWPGMNDHLAAKEQRPFADAHQPEVPLVCQVGRVDGWLEAMPVVSHTQGQAIRGERNRQLDSLRFRVSDDIV